MSAERLLTHAQLVEITGKKRAHCQHAWFVDNFGVDLPRTSERVIISPQLWETLQQKRAGLLLQATSTEPERPRLYSLKKSAA